MAALDPMPPGADHEPWRSRWRPWWLLLTLIGALLTTAEASAALLRGLLGASAGGWLAAAVTTGPGLVGCLAVATLLAPLCELLARGLSARVQGAAAATLAWLLAGAGLATPLAALLAGAMTWRAERITDRPFALALVALAAAAGALGGGLATWGLGAALLRWLPPQPPRLAVGLFVGLLGLATAALLAGLLVAFDQPLAALRAPLWLMLWLDLVLLATLLGAALPSLRARWLQLAAWRGVVPLSLGLTLTALLASALLLHFKPGAAALLQAGGGPAARTLAALRALSDVDRDGAAAWLGGGDCAPLSSARHPLAMDLPGNGVDENCDGRDAAGSAAQPAKGSARFGAVPPELVRRRNLLIICIDALRADRVGFWGHPRPVTPYLDRLAAQSWVFTDAQATSSTTRQSVPPLFAGRWVSGLRWKPGSPVDQLDKANVFLAEILKAQGYRTMAVVDEWLPKFLHSFNQGWDSFEAAYGVGHWGEAGQQAAPHTNARAMQRMLERDAKQPFLLYLHYEAPHFPYQAHPAVVDFGQKPLDLYDAEVAYVDRAIGQLLEMFKARGWLDDTIVVLFSDHGEEFGEHGKTQHSRSLHVESVHVPLLLRLPDQAPRQVAQRVSLVDVVPTLLDLLGIPAPELKAQGRSLLYPVLANAEAESRPFLAELRVNDGGKHEELRALWLGRHKLIWNITSGEKLVYDVRVDPKETRALDDVKLIEQLSQRLQHELAAAAQP